MPQDLARISVDVSAVFRAAKKEKKGVQTHNIWTT